MGWRLPIRSSETPDNLLTMAVLRGRVASGDGDLNRWIELYSDGYAAATGLRLFPGSLNILLDDPWQLPDETLQVPEERVGRLVHLVPCQFMGRSCFLFRTDNAERLGGDEHLILEVLSDVRLRSAHGLSDGDVVEVTVGN